MPQETLILGVVWIHPSSYNFAGKKIPKEGGPRKKRARRRLYKNFVNSGAFDYTLSSIINLSSDKSYVSLQITLYESLGKKLKKKKKNREGISGRLIKNEPSRIFADQKKKQLRYSPGAISWRPRRYRRGAARKKRRRIDRPIQRDSVARARGMPNIFCVKKHEF